MTKEIVKMQNICKCYGNGVWANQNAMLSVCEGEIHALAGENGAGKSTLMKILCGVEKPTSGNIFIEDKEVKINSPKAAQNLGIGMVHQHFMLVEELTVAENIVLGSEPIKRLLLDRKKAESFTNNLSEEFDMPVDAKAKVSELSIVSKQKVEILKMLAKNCKILILDEPTAVLTPQETDEFFKQLLLLKRKGFTTVIITHKLKEIKQICDRITVMRSGKFVAEMDVSEVSEQEISRLMVGRDVIRNVEKKEAVPGGKALSVVNLNKEAGGKKLLNDVNFVCRKGEIVCLAGVEGNGQRETVRIITGLDKNYTGSVLLAGEDIKSKNIRRIRESGLSHIPEDRMSLGVDLSANIEDNLIATELSKSVSKGIFVSGKISSETSRKSIESFDIKCDGAKQQVAMLSGGNMQKVVLARETLKTPELLVADQPTRGVDVGAIEFIHKKLVSLRDEGCAILLISSDLSEVFALSDRILVFHGGEIAADIADVKNLTEEQLGLYMLGLLKQIGGTANE